MPASARIGSYPFFSDIVHNAKWWLRMQRGKGTSECSQKSVYTDLSFYQSITSNACFCCVCVGVCVMKWVYPYIFVNALSSYEMGTINIIIIGNTLILFPSLNGIANSKCDPKLENFLTWNESDNLWHQNIKLPQSLVHNNIITSLSLSLHALR